MLPGGLRTKLVLAFAGVILLSITLAGLAFVYQLRPYQTQQSLNRLADLAVPLNFQVRFLESQGASLNEIADFLDEQGDRLDVRILLLHQANQTVVHDTDDTLVGHVLVFDRDVRSPSSFVVRGTLDVPGEGTLAVVSFAPIPSQPLAPGTTPDRPVRRAAPQTQYSVALAAPQSTLASSWLRVAPQLWTAGLIALFVSIVVALFIARSISRPLAAITRAAEGMAQGDYNQQIEVRGHDEVARVASTFNVMAQQIARSNRTLRDFLADVSHELRTPLTTIQGFAQAIQDGTASDRASIEECARIIKEDADRMHRMVEDLLYLSRIQSGQQSMDLEPVDLVPIVEGAVKRARQRTQGQTLDLEANGHVQLVRADAHRVDQVLDNLLANALNHTPTDGTITVEVKSRGSEEQVRVHNTGSYVPPEDRDRIFERFWRANGDGSGSGLGLSIAQQIARSHGGRIDVDSSPGQGTAFTLVLPAGGARSSPD